MGDISARCCRCHTRGRFAPAGRVGRYGGASGTAVVFVAAAVFFPKVLSLLRGAVDRRLWAESRSRSRSPPWCTVLCDARSPLRAAAGDVGVLWPRRFCRWRRPLGAVRSSTRRRAHPGERAFFYHRSSVAKSNVCPGRTSLGCISTPRTSPPVAPTPAIGAVVDTLRSRRSRRTGSSWPGDDINRRGSRYKLRCPGKAGRRRRQGCKRSATITAAPAPEYAAAAGSIAAAAAANGAAARQPGVSVGKWLGFCGGGNPQR